ncbi:MAG: hypothetical protein E6G92_01115 [Alphaproteobacteria bacterium]|nr:MAG: hypothetical protein E6G92_01115 [Alphaproteobacteria bacterium]
MEENPIRAPNDSSEAAALVPVHASDTEAYWRGYHAALAAQAPPDDGSSPRVRRTRVDGFDGARQVVFLEGVAEGLTVAAAAGRAGISVTAVYNFRNRRAGRAFNLAWEAASRRARRPLADRLHDRSLEGQTETFRDRDGEIVGTRHRHDNRLAMAMLTRLDRKAEGSQEDERLVTSLAEEFEELLDCIEEGGDAEGFIDERRPSDAPPAEREQEALRRRYEGIDPADIDISDLHFDEDHQWTADQRYRAEKAGFYERYWEAWEGPDGPKDDEWKLPAAYRDALRLRDHG